MGFIEIIIGPMFSGKTSKLIHLYNERLNDKIMAINYDKDTRYGKNKIVSHDGDSINCIALHCLDDIWNSKYEKSILDTDFIFINEAQFFNNLKNWVLNIVEKYNKNVILCGLDSDFKREKFGELLDLIPHSHKITKLNGTCSKCSEPSIYTHRITKETEQEVIGIDNYIPLCRTCYLSLNSDI